MASMNKPSAGDTNWYQPVTDNWTSIENNLIDKSILTTKGDLIAASGSSTPARVGVGSNGQVLTADSSQTAGVKWSDVTADTASMAMQKGYFSTLGLLPANVIKEELYTMPTTDFSNLSGGTLTRSAGQFKYTPNSTHSNWGWDMGSAYSSVLFIVTGIRARSYNLGLLLAPTLPSSAHPGDGYMFLNEPYTPAMKLYRNTGGTGETQLASEADIGLADSVGAPFTGLALYCDGSGHSQKGFVRIGSGGWVKVVDTTDSNLSTFRYAGFFVGSLSNQVVWATCPIGIYAA